MWKLPVALLVLLIQPIFASDSTTPIATDRPAVTDSSVVVPVGSLQAENGFAYTVDHGQGTFDVPESLVRFGVTGKTEFRFTFPDYFAALPSDGFGDLAIGMKQQLGPIHNFDVSLVLTLSLPTGSKALSSHGYDPSVQVPWSRSLSANWTAAGMFSVYFPTEGSRRNITGETAFLIDRQLNKPCDAFVEYVGDFPQAGGPRHLLHVGTAFKVSAHHQFDLHAGVGLSRAALDHFIGVGYSFRLQAFGR
jgi:hypothetical protein